MAKRLLISLSLLSCAFAGTAVDASAAKKKAVKKPALPTVRSIVPMKAQVGEKLTINGTNFTAGNGKTKVYFLREGGGVAWVPSDSGTKTRLIVTVPEKLIPLMRGTAEARKATRFQIRLLTKRFGTATKLSKSPLLTAPNAAPGEGTPGPADPGPGTPPDGDCDGDGAKNSVDADDDNDALTDDLEALPAHTDPCKADTDGDTVADGFEYHSARDLNVSALPYPSKKPWPNPLDSTDANIDHDGDGLYMIDEYQLWKYYGNLSVPLNYSAGLQRSVDEDAPADIHSAYRDVDGNGKLSDDERDGDGDGLNNWDEAHGRMLQKWWDTIYNGTNGAPKETRYPNDFPGVSIFDPDSDGDGVKDGEDDQDHDGLSNRFEVERPANWMNTYIWYGSFPFPGAGDAVFPDGANPWSRVQPYNPCKPVRSHTCHLYVPPGYYDAGEIWGGVKRENAGPQPVSPWTYLPDGGDELPQYPG